MKKPTVILHPIEALLRSRKFLIALLIVIMQLLSSYTSLPADALENITNVLMLVIGAIAIEDAAQKWGGGSTKNDDA